MTQENSTTVAQLGSMNILSTTKLKASSSSSLWEFGWPFGSIMPVRTRSECSTIIVYRSFALGTLATRKLKKGGLKLQAGSAHTLWIYSFCMCVCVWVSCCEVTGSVIGPRGFYLAALTGNVNVFFSSSTPNGLVGHLELITKTSINCFNCHGREREGACVRLVHFLSLIIRQTFVSRRVWAISMHITKRPDACSFFFCLH